MKPSQKLSSNSIDAYFKQWHELKTELHELHQERSKQTASLIERGVQLFSNLLAVCGGELIPLNCQERLDFIACHPSNYTAFRQLDELFTELKKKVSAKRVQLNKES